MILSLYRQRLRAADRFQNWNYRQYFRRQAREEFSEALREKDATKLSEFVRRAKEDQLVVERQSYVNAMYAHNDLIINVLKENPNLKLD